MTWFQDWINQIVLAVIICILIELILPENTSKKYVKAVIGIYMLFSVFSPIANLIEKKEWEKINLNNIFSESLAVQETSSNISNENIENIYLKELEENILKNLEEKGYIAENIEIEIKKDGTYALSNISIENLEKLDPFLEGMPVTQGELHILIDFFYENYGISKENISLSRKER